MTVSFNNLVTAASIVTTLLIGGVKWGSLEAKVDGKASSDDVAALKAQVTDVQSDVHDIKRLLQKR